MSIQAYAVIMAGGRGERLWPLTAKIPKQFLPLIHERTLLQETYDRLQPLIPSNRIYVFTGRNWVDLARAQLPEVPPPNIIGEPMGRNTAPCIGLAAIALEKISPESVMVALPADHSIRDAEGFRRLLKTAIEAAKENWLVTLGIMPDRPSTGYGYIERGDTIKQIDGFTCYRVAQFAEKPDKASAKRFFEEKRHWWNSGIFIWKTKAILEEFAQHLPVWHSGLSELRPYIGTKEFDKVAEKIFQDRPGISIDYGIMEKTNRAMMISADIGWSDIGNWVALAELLGYNSSRNSVQAKHIGFDTEGSIIYTHQKNKLVGTLGVRDLVIVDSGEALLVMHKDRVQEIRKIVEYWAKLGESK